MRYFYQYQRSWQLKRLEKGIINCIYFEQAFNAFLVLWVWSLCLYFPKRPSFFLVFFFLILMIRGFLFVDRFFDVLAFFFRTLIMRDFLFVVRFFLAPPFFFLPRFICFSSSSFLLLSFSSSSAFCASISAWSILLSSASFASSSSLILLSSASFAFLQLRLQL